MDEEDRKGSLPYPASERSVHTKRNKEHNHDKEDNHDEAIVAVLAGGDPGN